MGNTVDLSLVKATNTVYVKTAKRQRKVKVFKAGEKENAMVYGWKVAEKHREKDYFIITEDKKCLRFNSVSIQ